MRIEKFTSLKEEIKKLLIEDHNMIASSIGFSSESSKDIDKYFEKDLSGVVCLDDESVVGLLVAEVAEKAAVKPMGFYADKTNTDEIIYRMYQEVSRKWVLEGIHNHTFEVLNFEVYNEALLKLGFGFQQVHALLKTEDYFPFEVEKTVRVRSLKESDGELLRKFADIIYSFQNDAPVFASAPRMTIEDIRKGYAGLVDDKEVVMYIAEKEEPLGFQGYWPEEVGYMIPEKSAGLVIAGTLKEAAGQGVGKQLMDYAMNDLNEKFEWIVTDWRITNITSRTFWEKCEFQIVKNRFVRIIEPDFVWGDFS